MEHASGVTIRRYKCKDKGALRQLCCDTAYFGEPCEAFFPDRHLLADVLTAYYLDYEPDHTWVAEHNGEVVGYLSACFDKTSYSKIMAWRIVPQSVFKALLRGKLFSNKTWALIMYNLRSFLSREAQLTQTDEEKFPVNIHQNVKNGFRGKGIGTRLLEAFLEEAKGRIRGIRFRALREVPHFLFFEKYGFKLFGCKRVPSWEQWLGRKPLYFMEYAKSFCSKE